MKYPSSRGNKQQHLFSMKIKSEHLQNLSLSTVNLIALCTEIEVILYNQMYPYLQDLHKTASQYFPNDES